MRELLRAMWRLKMLMRKKKQHRFNEVGKQEGVTVKTEREEDEVTAKVADDGWKTRMEEMMLNLGENAVAQRGLMEVHTEKMTQSVDMIMRMVAVVKQQILPTQQRMIPKAPAEPKQPVLGASPIKPVSSSLATTPTKKRKDTTTTSIPVKKDIPRPAGQNARKDDEPAPQPPKKTKMVARKSGPPGDHSQN